MKAEITMGDRRGRARRPVLVLTGSRDEIGDLEVCVASALDGGERGTGGAHADFDGLYLAVRVLDELDREDA